MIALGIGVSAQIALPYNETFASMTTANVLPTVTGGAWTRTGTTTLQPSYITNQTTYNRTGNGDTKFITFRYGNTAGNFYLVGPFDLTAGTSYNASILYKADGLTGFGPLALTYGTAATAATQTNTIASLAANITNTAFAKLAGNFTVSTSGSYYVGVKCTSTSNPWYLTLDDFELKLSPTCLEPTGLAASNVTTSSADLSWTAPASVPANGYDVYYSTSSTAPTATTTPNVTGVTSTTLPLTGLSSGNNYYVWVRSNCSATDVSSWSSVFNFATLCTSASIPYTQDFESATVPGLPICTSIQHVGTTGNDWKTSSPAANGFTTKTLTYGYSSTYAANAWFFTQGINLDAGTTYRIKFRYGNNSTTFVEKLKVAYGTSADYASMTNPLLDYPSVTGGVANNGFADFTPATTGVYYFGFNAYSAANQYNLFVDDIEVNTAPTCIEPTSLATTNVTSSSADVTWVAPASAPANGYQVYYSTSSTPPNATTVLDGTNSVTSTTTSATISGLAAATKYYVWLRSVCSETDLSSWTSSVSFTTLCSFDLPYTENFESVTTPAMPTCASIQNAGTGNNWATYSLTTAAFGFPATKLLRYAYNSTNAANAWFYTKGLNLTGGVKYELKFRAGSSNADYTEKMKVAYGTSPVNTAMTTVLADYPEVIHADSSVDTYYFTPATTGVYYVGFNAYSDLDQAYLYLDDISVKVAPSCTIPGVPVASNITQNSATLTWTAADTSPAGYDVYYSTSSTAPDASTTPNYSDVSGLSQDVTGLTAGTTYYAWVRSACSTTDKSDWTSKATFVSQCVASVPAPYSQDFEVANPGSLPNCTTTQNLSAGNNWTIYNNGTTTLTGKWLICPASTTAASNAWFYTPGIYLEAGKSYKVTYKYAGAAADKLKVAYGTAANSTDMTTVLADLTCTGTTTINNGSNIFTVPAAKASGVYYLGFNANSAANQSFVAIDNIAVVEEITLGTDTSVKEKVGVYPNPFHDVVTISDITNVKSISVSDISGRSVKTFDKPSTTLNLGSLKEGLYIISLHMKDGTVKPIKVIKK